MNNKTRTLERHFEPAKQIANLIRSKEDAQILLDPFESLCHKQDGPFKFECLSTLYRFRTLIESWDTSFSDDAHEEFEKVQNDYVTHVQSLGDDREEDYLWLLGEALRVAFGRRTSATTEE